MCWCGKTSLPQEICKTSAKLRKGINLYIFININNNLRKISLHVSSTYYRFGKGLPLFLAGLPIMLSICQYCVTHCCRAYFRAMQKFIIILLSLLASAAVAEVRHIMTKSKVAMIEDIHVWVANETGIESAYIEVLALDRRLKVPICPSSFDVSFPYSKSQQTVRVKCPDSEWFAYVGIRLKNNIKGLAYRYSHKVGETLTQGAFKSVLVSKTNKNLVTSANDISNMLLVKDVVKGEVARNNHFIDSVMVANLKKDVLKGDAITLDDVYYEAKSTRTAATGTLFPKALLKNATAARDLSSGSILSRSDLNIRNFILTSTKTISRGQLLNARNAKITAFYGNLPSDVLYSLDDGRQMEAIRTIRLGQPLRASDLRPSLMIKKGDMVILSVQSGILTITSTMVALGNGKLGQQVTLLNPESNEEVRGLVTGIGRASSF